MKNTIVLFLIIFMKISLCFSSEESISIYEKEAKADHYKNVCLIKSYHGNEYKGHGTGTLVKDTKTGKTYILTVSHFDNADRLTATFEGQEEQKIRNFETLVFKLNDQDDQKKQEICFTRRADIAIGFLDKDPEGIEPASLAPLTELSNEGKEICQYFYGNTSNTWFQVVEDFRNINNIACHLAGYGMLVHPISVPNLFILKKNEKLIKTAITLRVNQSNNALPEGLSPTSLRLESTFKRKDESTSLESPGSFGFSGSSLRDENDLIIGVASHGEYLSALENPDFCSEFPKFSKVLRSFHCMSAGLEKYKPYICPTIVVFGALSYYIVNDSWVRWGALALTGIAYKYKPLYPMHFQGFI